MKQHSPTAAGPTSEKHHAAACGSDGGEIAETASLNGGQLRKFPQLSNLLVTQSRGCGKLFPIAAEREQSWTLGKVGRFCSHCFACRFQSGKCRTVHAEEFWISPCNIGVIGRLVLFCNQCGRARRQTICAAISPYDRSRYRSALERLSQDP